MNFQEIKAKIDELEITKNDFAYEWDDETNDPIFGKVKDVERKGGEGQGEAWHLIRHFVDHNVYIRLKGFYSSYDGANFNRYDYEEVFPEQVIKTIYKTK